MQGLFENIPTYRRDAVFNADRSRRYVLTRIWDDSRPIYAFIGLNPSTADDKTDDPTIRKIRAYCKAWGCGGFYMLNLFSQVTPYPEELTDTNCISVADFYWITRYVNLSEKIIFCWGSFKNIQARADNLIRTFPNAFCLGHNRNGTPFHPMYKNPNLKLIRYGRD